MKRKHFLLGPGAPDPSTPKRIVKYSEEWWATRTPEVRARRCTAHRSNGSGERCRRVAVEGATVCPQHGGGAPQVKRKARERIDLAADRMAAALLRIATSAESEAVKLRAIESALDRAGLRAPASVELEVGPTPAWQRLITGIAPTTREESRRRRGLPDKPTSFALDPADDDDEHGEIVDAELVDEDTGMGPHLAQDRRNSARRPTEREPAEPSAYAAAGPPLTGMRAIEAAAAANRAAGVYPTRRRRG